MSSILKALQKLERDKEARNSKEPDITSAIRMSVRRRKTRPAFFMPVMVIAVAIVSILATFSLMGGFSSKRKEVQQAVNTPLPTERNPVANIQNEASQSSIDDTFKSVAKPIFHSAITQTVKNKSATATGSRSAVPQQSPDQQNNGQQLESTPAASPVPDIQEIPANPTPKPKLKVSGIAWQSDSASRIAVVNGTSVSEGSSVADVKVEQIFPDRVKFSRNGKLFEILLDHEGELK